MANVTTQEVLDAMKSVKFRVTKGVKISSHDESLIVCEVDGGRYEVRYDGSTLRVSHHDTNDETYVDTLNHSMRDRYHYPILHDGLQDVANYAIAMISVHRRLVAMRSPKATRKREWPHDAH